MNEFPLVSVIIACYNHEKYVEGSLSSIVANTYPNKEIVIIDDGSTDSSYERIKVWQSANQHTIKIRTIRRENKGLTSTLNELVALAEGEYLCLLASDDLLTNDSIERRVKRLLQNPDKLVVIGDATVINSDGEITMKSAIEDLYHGNKNDYKTLEGLKHSVVNEWSIPGPVVLVKKSLYDIIGKYPTNMVAEDLNFYLQVIGRNLLVFEDAIVALYRVHDQNMCRVEEKRLPMIESFIKSYYNNLKYFHGENKYRIYRKMLSMSKMYCQLYVNNKLAAIRGK